MVTYGKWNINPFWIIVTCMDFPSLMLWDNPLMTLCNTFWMRKMHFACKVNIQYFHSIDPIRSFVNFQHSTWKSTDHRKTNSTVYGKSLIRWFMFCEFLYFRTSLYLCVYLVKMYLSDFNNIPEVGSGQANGSDSAQTLYKA